jgi:hypothetical protein
MSGKTQNSESEPLRSFFAMVMCGRMRSHATVVLLSHFLQINPVLLHGILQEEMGQNRESQRPL